MENFIDAPFGAIDVTRTAKYSAQPRTFLLEENNGNEYKGQNQLNNVIDILFHKEKIARCRSIGVKTLYHTKGFCVNKGAWPRLGAALPITVPLIVRLRPQSRAAVFESRTHLRC